MFKITPSPYDTLYEDENRICEVESFKEKTILKKDSSRNFESLLSSIKERGGKIKICVNEELYNKNPRKFAREFYKIIENQPTGFETEKEPSIFEYIEPYLYFGRYPSYATSFIKNPPRIRT